MIQIFPWINSDFQKNFNKSKSYVLCEENIIAMTLERVSLEYKSAIFPRTTKNIINNCLEIPVNVVIFKIPEGTESPITNIPNPLP